MHVQNKVKVAVWLLAGLWMVTVLPIAVAGGESGKPSVSGIESKKSARPGKPKPKIPDEEPPDPVFEKNGNIFLREKDGGERQLTNSGKDSGPELSPDGKLAVFSRNIEDPECPEGYNSRWCADEELWAYDLPGKSERLLMRPSGTDKEPTRWINHFWSKRFSPDGRTLYFLAGGTWYSSAIHAMNIDGSNERYISFANHMRVIGKSKDKKWNGHLLVYQHLWEEGRGTYDRNALLTPDGKVVKTWEEGEVEAIEKFIAKYKIEFMPAG